MKILGLDIGDATTGIAIADSSGIFISTRPDINSSVLIDSLIQLIKKELVTTIVYGLPLNSLGEEAFQCKKVRTMVESIAQAFAKEGLNITFFGVDERRSSIGAQLVKQNVGGKTRGSEHAIAAALLLEIYFQKYRNLSQEEEEE